MDRIFAEAGGWALASDGVQWMLCRRHTRKSGDTWDPIWFVRSHRDVLAMGMREKGVDAGTANLLLSGLPDTFDQWKAAQPATAARHDAPAPIRRTPYGHRPEPGAG